MSEAICNPCPCPSPVVVAVPGAPGQNAQSIPPGIVDPEGNVIGNPGQTYRNLATGSFWHKDIGTGNTGWSALIEAPA